MTDPTDTWRATFAGSGQSTSAQLRQAQAALAASQADLTAMQARYEEARHEAKEWRATANRYLTHLGEVGRDLASARYQNRRLTAELDSALGRLNEKEKP